MFFTISSASCPAYTGYGSVVSLGEEARAPQKNIGLSRIYKNKLSEIRMIRIRQSLGLLAGQDAEEIVKNRDL